MGWKHYASVALTTLVVIFAISFIAEMVGFWGWVFQPYSKVTGKATVE